MMSMGFSTVKGVLWVALIGLPGLAVAQTDEIQVYDAGIADKGKFNLTVHDNFIPRGSKIAAFPGGIVPNQSFNGVMEWAYGVNRWFEAGLYLPLYTIAPAGASINGFKLRALFVRPDANSHKFIYGVNFEFSVNRARWDPRPMTSEIRPIVGWHLKPFDIIFNPILDTSYTGGVKSLDFAPATRIAYNLSPQWAVAVEEYADFGRLRQILPVGQEAHLLFAVFDHTSKTLDVEFGVGFGLTAGSDKLTLKVILSRDISMKSLRRLSPGR